MVFGQEMESPSGGVLGETLPRRTCAAMCRENILGVNISSSEPLALFYAQMIHKRCCFYHRGFTLKTDSKKKVKKKISAMHGHQSIQAQKKLTACD